MTALLSGVDLARAVLKAKDRYELLSLGSIEPIRVGDDGFLNVEDEDVRRVYIKMSVKIHPDKLREFPEATKAFQALVRAYELCCKPDLREDESDDSRSGGDESDDDEEEEAGADESDDDDEAAAPAAPRARAKAPTSYAEVDSDEDLDEDSDEDEAPKKRAPKRAPKAKAGKQPPRKKKAPTAKKKKKAPRQRRRRSTAANTRGDAAERRTGVSCPRCSSGWGDHLRGEGQEGLYTEFMRGARRVSCTSCLFEFGCLSAGHACPDCGAPFEYRPQRFDAAFVCSRKSCGATFSVARFALSRAAKAGEADRKADEPRKRKAEAASRARGARGEAARRRRRRGRAARARRVHRLRGVPALRQALHVGPQEAPGDVLRRDEARGQAQGRVARRLDVVPRRRLRRQAAEARGGEESHRLQGEEARRGQARVQEARGAEAEEGRGLGRVRRRLPRVGLGLRRRAAQEAAQEGREGREAQGREAQGLEAQGLEAQGREGAREEEDQEVGLVRLRLVLRRLLIAGAPRPKTRPRT